jgi:hypothetical protein
MKSIGLIGKCSTTNKSKSLCYIKVGVAIGLAVIIVTVSITLGIVLKKAPDQQIQVTNESATISLTSKSCFHFVFCCLFILLSILTESKK